MPPSAGLVPAAVDMAERRRDTASLCLLDIGMTVDAVFPDTTTTSVCEKKGVIFDSDFCMQCASLARSLGAPASPLRSRMTLLALPDEIIRAVLIHSTGLGLLRAASTCRQLRAVEAQHREDLWEAIYRDARFTNIIGPRPRR